MNLPAGLLTDGWTIAGWVAFLLITAAELRAKPWRVLAADNRLNLWLGSIVALIVLWSMQAGVKPGLNLHFLGANVLVLAVGRPLAFLALSLVLAAVTFNDGSGWQSYGLNAILLAVIPAFVSQLIFEMLRRHLPAQVFVFILGNGFFGTWFTFFLTGAMGLGVLALTGAYSPGFLLREYLPFFLLLGFAEAWLSGTVVTLLVIYRPRWILAFDEQRYIGTR